MAVSEWIPSSPAAMVRLPPAMVTSPSVWMPSSGVVISMLPDSI